MIRTLFSPRTLARLVSPIVAASATPALAQPSPDSGVTFHNAPTFREWPFPGDANRDGVIDSADVARVNADLGQAGMVFIPRVVGRGGPDMDGPVGDGVFGFLWSDFNHDRVVDATDAGVVQAAIVSMTSGAFTLNADGSVAMGGTEYGQALVFPEGPIDFDTWNGVFYPYNRQPQRVLLTHLGMYDPETGVRVGANTDPMLPGVFVLTGKYLGVASIPMNNPPTHPSFDRHHSTINDFRVDYTAATNGMPRESLSWFGEASIYYYATDFRNRYANDVFVDAAVSSPQLATNLITRQFRPDLIDNDPNNSLRAGKPLIYSLEAVDANGILLYPVPNAALVSYRSLGGFQASLSPVSFSLESDAWIGDYAALAAQYCMTQNRQWPTEVLFGQNNAWITNVLPAMSDGWSAWVALRCKPSSHGQIYQYSAAAIYDWGGNPCGTAVSPACHHAVTLRNVMMTDEADASANGVFPYSWPGGNGSFGPATGADLAGLFIAAIYYDISREAGLGDFRTDLLSWKVISLIDDADGTTFPMRQFGVRVQQAARMLWPDPAFPAWPDPAARSIYENDIADVLTSRGVPVNGVADFRTLLPPAIGPVVPADTRNFGSFHPDQQVNLNSYGLYSSTTRTYTHADAPAYVAYQFYKHSKFGPCDHVFLTDGTMTTANQSFTSDGYNNDGTATVALAAR